MLEVRQKLKEGDQRQINGGSIQKQNTKGERPIEREMLEVRQKLKSETRDI